MKRFLFSVCALAAVVVGCSKSEVLNRPNAEVPIEFNPYAGRVPVTRATADDIKTLGTDGFQVYAFFHSVDEQGESGEPDWSSPYMDKVVKYGKKTTDAEETPDYWYYSGHAYWPASKELAFIAYGLNAEEQITPVDGAPQKIDFTVAEVVASQKDLLVAAIQRNKTYVEGVTEGDGTVNFTFSHLLSRIGFSLVTKDNNAIPVTIEQVKLEGTFYEKGQVDLSIAPTTTIKIGGEDTAAPRPVIAPGQSKPITYDLLPGGSYTSNGSADGTPIYDNSMLYTKEVGNEGPDDDQYVPKDFIKDGEVDATAKKNAEDQAAANLLNRYMMIIPTTTPAISSGQSATTLPHNAHLKVLYFLPGAGTFKEVDVDLSAIEFEPGKSYNFKFKVSTAGISFSVTVEPWDENGLDSEGDDRNDVYQLN